MKSIYENTYSRQARTDEQQRGNRMFQASLNPMANGVVSHTSYASQFQPLNAENMSLTGEPMRNEDFKHNNMQPFFRGSVKQNMNLDSRESGLERFTGRGDTYKNKQEVEAFFTPQKGVTNVCGMKSATDFYESRVVNPIARNNDFPIAQVHVGPGLGKGYNALPSGGFQQGNTLDLIRPKTVDELRVANKPKTVKKGRPTGPGKGNSQISSIKNIGTFDKNRPDTWYEQTPDQWIKTTGAVKEATGRPVTLMKPTARIDSHVEYQGQAVGTTTNPGNGNKDDYGKATILVYDNERDVSGVRTVMANVTSMVKSVIAPLLDVFKHSTKEYTVDSGRHYGNMKAQMPSKATLYDPVYHVARTTIKETTIHDSSLGNVVAGKEGYVEKIEDMKPTVRETLPVDDTYRNMNSHVYHTIVYDPDAVAKTTVRETTEDNIRQEGNIGGETVRRHGAYKVIDFDIKNTSKQFLSDHDYTGDSKSVVDFRPMSYEAEYNMEIDGTRSAMELSMGHTPNAKAISVALDSADIPMENRRQDVGMAERASGNVGHVYQYTQNIPDTCTYTKPPNQIPLEDRRLEPDLLDAYRNNPFTHSLNSVA